MRILLITGNIKDIHHVENSFLPLNYVCDVVDNGADGIQLSRTCDYDIIVADFLISDMNGHDFIVCLRKLNIKIPILIISASPDINAKVKALALGADDYLVKPFDNRELIARVQAIIRRSKGFSSSVIEYNGITVNLNTGTAELCGKPLCLTNAEYISLEILILRQGKIIPRTTFLDHRYGGFNEPDYKVTDVIICKLRKKLSLATGGINYIKSIWGMGYILLTQNQ